MTSHSVDDVREVIKRVSDALEVHEAAVRDLRAVKSQVLRDISEAMRRNRATADELRTLRAGLVRAALKHVTQAELAGDLGVSQQAVSKWLQNT